MPPPSRCTKPGARSDSPARAEPARYAKLRSGSDASSGPSPRPSRARFRTGRDRCPRRSACRPSRAVRPRARRARRCSPRPPGRFPSAPPRRSCRHASARPKRRLRDWLSVLVSTRSPRPARPMKVSGCAPSATPRRITSDRPRVISAMRVFAPKPRPSESPAPTASTFFTAPPTSTPTMSVEV